MAENAVGRRQVLTAAGAAASGAALGGLLAATPAMAGESHDDRRGLSGSWLVTSRVDVPEGAEPIVLTVVLSFAAGSVIIVHDINPPAPSSTGTWVSWDDGRFRAKAWASYGETDRLRLVLEGSLKRGDLPSSSTSRSLIRTTGWSSRASVR